MTDFEDEIDESNDLKDMEEPERKHTNRGFQLIEFNDRYNNPCSLQQSSLADYVIPGTSAVWLGVNTEDGTRMHLDVAQVKWLVKELQYWLDEGVFTGYKKEEEEDHQ